MNEPIVKTISCAELHRASLNGPIDLIDVRTPEEFADVRAAGARNMPLDGLNPAAIGEQRVSPPDAPLYFICAVGGRSEWACRMMMAAGIESVVNVEGGTKEWYFGGLPTESGAPAQPGSVRAEIVPP